MRKANWIFLCLLPVAALAQPSVTVPSPTINGTSYPTAQHTFTLQFTDPNYWPIGNSSVSVWFQNGTAACNIGYSFGYFWLTSDDATFLYGPLTPNSSSTIANSFCSLTMPQVSGAGTQLTLTLPITFTQAFVGTSTISAEAWSGSQNSGRVGVGSWIDGYPSVGLQFVPITPCRILDTRITPNGPFAGPYIAGNTQRDIPVQSYGNPCNLPSSALSYSLNATIIPRVGALYYLTLWPMGQGQPFVSTMNSPDGATLANAALVPTGTGGGISAYVTQDSDLALDINGYFTSPTSGSLQFYPLPPCRLVDTRYPAGTPPGNLGGGTLTGGITRTYTPQQGACGVPSTAAAYSLALTALPPGTLWFLSVWPHGQPWPGVSTINPDGTATSNAAIVPAGTGGALDFYASQNTDLIVDINGYFAPPGTGGNNFYALTPCRAWAWYNPPGAPSTIQPAGATWTYPLSTGQNCGLSSTAAAYSLNITAQPSGNLSYLTAWASGPTPNVWMLADPNGLAWANAALTPTANGSISLYTTTQTGIIIDTNGFFGPPPNQNYDFAVTGTAVTPQPIAPGGMAKYSVVITPQNGYSGPVCLATSALPAGVTSTLPVYRSGSNCVGVSGPTTVPVTYYTNQAFAPGTGINPTVWAWDNVRPDHSVQLALSTAAATNIADPKRVGTRATGSYWGAAGEQIDVGSGNLNFTLPLINAQARGGWSATFALSYNSQTWVQNSTSGVSTNLGRDIGYGSGWMIQAGSIVPQTGSNYYIFRDSTGAEYKLNWNAGNLYTSTQGIHVTFDASASKLYFPDGSFWVMNVVAAPGEPDAGTLYPSVMEDSNGNYITVQYCPGLGGGDNASGRIKTITDVRVTSPYTTYMFNYTDGYAGYASCPALNGTAIRLKAIGNNIFSTEAYQFSYSSNTQIRSPFSTSGNNFWPANLLTAVTVTMPEGPISHQFAYFGNVTNELTQVTTPLGGTLGWGYQTFTYGGNGGPAYREVRQRNMQASASFSNSWTIDPTGSSHTQTTLSDTGASTSKVWTFGTSGAGLGLASTYEERGSQTLLHKDFTWTTDVAGNVYLGTVVTTLNPGAGGATQTTLSQVLDSYGYGNVVSSTTSGSDTATRTYSYGYLTDSNYTSRYIRNRLTSASVNGTTLVTNTYDAVNCTGSGLQNHTGLPLHDDTNYPVGFTYRGNLTTTTQMGVIRCIASEITGVPYKLTDGAGVPMNLSLASGTNYSLPASITPNTGNGSDSYLQTSVTYAPSFAVQTVTVPNGSQSTTQYDSVGRPASSTLADGAWTGYVYSYSPYASTQKAILYVINPCTPTCPNPPSTSGNRWIKTTVDGFGRTTKVEKGHDSTTVSAVDTLYTACACSPLGKVWKVSQPYGPGDAVVYTVYAYDASGRTWTVTAPDGASTTTYSYTGDKTTVTDPAGKWKTFTNDAYGNLAKVTEPNPAGGTMDTNYTYNTQNQLVTVNMPGRTTDRTFVWNGTDLTSATNPENGTMSYWYDSGHRPTKRRDAKGQDTVYSYDSYGRLKQVQHYPGHSDSTLEIQSQHVNYNYDTNVLVPGFSQYAWGRLTEMSFANEGLNTTEQFTYAYSYSQPGRMTAQRLRMQPANPGTNGTVDLDATYGWDTEGKMTSLTYPTSGIGLGTPPQYTYQYDVMGRLTGMKQGVCLFYSGALCANYDNSTMMSVASATQFNAAGQVLQMSYDGVSESRTYNSMLQLTQLGTAVGTFTYTYSTTQNNGRITQSTDAVTGETVQYAYDALNRLTGATATGGQWATTYSYDSLGNLTGKTGTGAASNTTQSQVSVILGTADANGNTSIAGGYPYDVENRLLQAGVPQWTYDPKGKRVFSQAGSTCEIYFYGITGQKLVTYTCSYEGQNNSGPFRYVAKSRNVYFGGKMMRSADLTVVTDQVGSVRASMNGGAWSTFTYFPYGEERVPTDQGREKFGTYTRDTTGLDYADQRYMVPGGGKFLTADPAGWKSVDIKNPASWNRYAYTHGDPINSSDPSGTMLCANWYYFLQSTGQNTDDIGLMGNCGPGLANMNFDFDACSVSQQAWGQFLDAAGVACEEDPEPPPQQSSPSQLTCSFHGAQFDPVNGEPVGSDHGRGWYADSVFGFEASGGTGSYSFLESQYYDISGSVVLNYNQTRSVNQSGNDAPLSFEQDGGRIAFNDAPGVPETWINGARVTSASYTGIFNLQVTVTSGTQVVSCSGVVPWYAKVTVANGTGSGTGALGLIPN